MYKFQSGFLKQKRVHKIFYALADKEKIAPDAPKVRKAKLFYLVENCENTEDAGWH